MEAVLSVHLVPIRLTSERWVHIVENHDDLVGRYHDALEVVAEPDLVLEGKAGEYLAVRKQDRRTMVVVYRIVSRTDGFVITAFQTSKLSQLVRTKKIIWRRKLSKKL